MAGVIVPASRKESSLDTIIKGLGIASSIYGIRANMAEIEQAKAKADEEAKSKADLKAGILPAEKKLELAGKTTVAPGTPDAQEFRFRKGDQVESVFIAPPREKSPVTDTVAQERLKLDRDRFAYEKQKDANPALQPAKPDQLKAATFAQRANQSEAIFDALAEEGYDRTSRVEGLKSLLPGAVAPNAGQLKRQEQAERNFVNAVLRRESGASISDQEYENAEKQYFPRAGDTPEVVEQKRQNRLATMAGLENEAGESGMAVANRKSPGLRPPTSRGTSGSWGISETATAKPGAAPTPEEIQKELARRGLKPGGG